MTDILIIGCGGLGKETAFTIERINSLKPQFNIVGFLDDNNELKGKIINNYKVLGKVEDIKLFPQVKAVIALGKTRTRENIHKILLNEGYSSDFPSIIDPAAIIDTSRTIIGEGSIICSNTYITTNITIGRFNYIGANSTVGHDCITEDFVTLYPGVNLSGNSKVCKRCELGTGSKIIQGLTIGENTIIGAGSVVIRDIPKDCTAIGVPAKPIK